MSILPPTLALRVEIASYDDFLVEYSEHLSKGKLLLPAPTTDTPPSGHPIRIQLELPDGNELFLCGHVSPVHTIGPDNSPSDADAHEPNEGTWQIKLDKLQAEQHQQLRACLEASLAATPSTFPQSRQLAHILLVDDCASTRLQIGDTLRNRGINVQLAENGLAAIAAALQHPPDLILSDVQMPVVDGWAFLRMARSRKSLADIPFVLFTSVTDEMARLQGYRLGVSAFLSKQQSSEEMVDCLEGIFLRHQQRLSSSPPQLANDSTPDSETDPPLQNPQEVLRGDLAHVGLTSLFFFLSTEKRTGRLWLRKLEESAWLRIHKGTLAGVDSIGDGQQSWPRVFELLDWEEGQFDFFPESNDLSEEIDKEQSTSLDLLLMEHARLRDEQKNC